MNEKPEPTRAQMVLGGVIMGFLALVVVGLFMASAGADKKDLSEFCRTEGTAFYRGAQDDDRTLRYMHACK